MKNNPFFSIVVPALEEEVALPLLLEDLCHQTFSDFEVIIVDGKSKDRTQDIVKEKSKTDTRFSLLISEKQHVSVQRNMGGNHAKGTYIFFMDADNRLPEYFLEGMHYHLLRTPYGGSTTYSAPDTNKVQDKMFIASLNQLISLSAKLKNPMIVLGACLCCSNEVFHAIGGFDETLAYAEDLDFVKRLSKHTDFHVFSHPTFTVSLRRFRKEGTLKIYRKLIPLFLKILVEGKVTEATNHYPMKGGSYYFSFEEKDKKNKKRNMPSFKKLVSIFKATKKLTRYSQKKIINTFNSIVKDIE